MEALPQAVIRVVGVGGGGGNAVNRMIEAELRGVEFIAVNTDAQDLLMCDADVKLEIGREFTHGLGAGADPEVGKKAASDHEDEIREVLEDSNMVFVTAGEGGGTGTGAAPIVAKVARDIGALTVGVVTRPFAFEARRRAEQAERGIEALREQVDALIVIPNERLVDSNAEDFSVLEAFRAADNVLQASVQGITEIITIPGTINVDFADVTATLKDAKTALMGIGTATGPERAMDAVEMAISSPLLETSMNGANRVLIFFQGGTDLGMKELNQAAQMVRDLADPEANIIVGFAANETFGDEVRVTVIAAGFEGSEEDSQASASVDKVSGNRPKLAPTSQKPSPVAAKANVTSTKTTVSAPPSAASASALNTPAGNATSSVAARLAEHRTKEKPVLSATSKLASAPSATSAQAGEPVTTVQSEVPASEVNTNPVLKVPDLNAPKFPAGSEPVGKAPVAPDGHNPGVKITGLAGIPDARREPLAVTSGIRPVSPDASTVPNYVDSSRDQAAPPLRLQQVFDDITTNDELDIPDFLR